MIDRGGVDPTSAGRQPLKIPWQYFGRPRKVEEIVYHILRVSQTASRSASLRMGDRMASPPGIEDQARLLEDALVMVRQQTHQMRKCLETPGKLMDALKCRYVSRIPSR